MDTLPATVAADRRQRGNTSDRAPLRGTADGPWPPRRGKPES
jgi:hypothetical protein